MWWSAAVADVCEGVTHGAFLDVFLLVLVVVLRVVVAFVSSSLYGCSALVYLSTEPFPSTEPAFTGCVLCLDQSVNSGLFCMEIPGDQQL